MSFVRVPPDSTGKKVYTVEQTIGADTVQTQVIHVADNKYPDQFQAIDKRGSSSVRFAEGQPILSGFGELKVSNKTALGVYESSQNNYDDLFYTELVNGGTNTYHHNSSSHVLSVTGDLDSRVTKTTDRYHYYLAGTSNIIVMTVSCGDAGKEGNVRRWGYFDDRDGLYFELDGTTLYAVIRTSTSGTVVEARVAQSNWNSDKIDGTGWSAHNLDTTKINVWWIDYQWLGSGRVRFGIFEPDGARLVCHQFENAGQKTVPYMRSGTLPLRIENVNKTFVGSSSEMRVVCMSIYAEGTLDYTYWRGDLDAPQKTVSTNTHIASLRVMTHPGHHNGVVTFPETLNVYASEPVAITLYQESEVVDGTWDSLTVTQTEADSTGTVNLTNAYRFKTFYFAAGVTTISLQEYFESNDEGIMLRADGEQICWSFVGNKLGSTDSIVKMNLGFRELW